jgi:hypothetical protein
LPENRSLLAHFLFGDIEDPARALDQARKAVQSHFPPPPPEDPKPAEEQAPAVTPPETPSVPS